VAFLDLFRTNKRSATESKVIEYDPETGLTRDAWNSMPEELRAVLPWNVYGNEDEGTKTNSGVYVSEDSAFKMGVVFAAITLIADGVASLPPHAYTLGADGNRQEQEVPQWISRASPGN
jgi:phage portal protein BeeE